MRKRVALLSLVLVLMSGCGTTTDSGGSSNANSSGSATSNSNSSGSNSSGSNSSGSGTSNGNSSETNSSSGAASNNNSSSTTDTGSIFDTTDAELDAKACGVFDDYKALTDSSLTPEGQEDGANAIAIFSSYSFTFNPEDSKVTLYYPTLQQTKQGKPYVSVYATYYTISFDKAWASNANNTVYVKTPKNNNGKFGCYRYILNDANTSNIVATKVYR